MSVQRFSSLGAAARKIASDSKARQKRVMQAVHKAADKTARVIARDVAPKAFGDLAESIHVEDIQPGWANIIADAPHAEAVEVGSRPHMPPLGPIIAWVRLRGIQGITTKGNVIRNPGIRPTTKGAQFLGGKRAAASIGHMLSLAMKGDQARMAAWRAQSKAEHGGVQGIGKGSRGLGAAANSNVDPATLAVARAIQMKIAKSGTKPFRYMRAGIPTAMFYLDTYVKAALQDPP